jgi:hypothetical protein
VVCGFDLRQFIGRASHLTALLGSVSRRSAYPSYGLCWAWKRRAKLAPIPL